MEDVVERVGPTRHGGEMGIPALDPWGAITSLLFESGSSDDVLQVLGRAGIPVQEFRLTSAEDFSHSTRKRAYLRHLGPIHESFDQQTRQRVAENIARELARADESHVNEALAAIGWGFRDNRLAPLVETGEGELDDRLPLYRRGAFDEDLRILATRALETGRPLSLLMIDLDRFKAVNDQHGHQVGDEVLLDCARIIAANAEGKGRAYRYGGEEITALLPNFSAREALAVAEGLRSSVEAARVGGRSLSQTVSVGVACLPDHAGTPEDLLHRADQALYRAKDLGRNLVRLSGEAEPATRTERSVERRQPVPGGLSDAEQEAIRLAHFRDGRANCPRDGAVLRVVEVNHMGLRAPGLLVSCPACGAGANIPGISV